MEDEMNLLDEPLDLGVISEEEQLEVQDLNKEHDIFGDTSVESLIEPTENNLIFQLLKSKGIENSKLTIIDENEVEKEVNFYDLTPEEQLEILNSNEPPIEEILDETEITLINHLRTNNLSIDEFLEQYKQSIIAEVQQSVEPSYEIDNYDDQELFLLDLKNKFDLSEDELQIELEKELKNPELFTKKTTKLRTDYKILEDQEKANRQAQFEEDQQKEYDRFVNTMKDVSIKVTDFHGVELEDSEKAETLSYLIALDESGASKFSRDLNDPNKLYEAAWYLRYGKEAFEALEAAYEAEIKKLKKKDEPRAVVLNSKSKNVQSINDLN